MYVLKTGTYFSPGFIPDFLSRLDLKRLPHGNSKGIRLFTSLQKNKYSTLYLSTWPERIQRHSKALIRDKQIPWHNLNLMNLTPWRVGRREEVMEEGVGGMPVTAALECHARMDSALAEQL